MTAFQKATTAPSLARHPPAALQAVLERFVRTRGAAAIFDVEGTLVDAAMPTMQCWRDTLAEFGFEFQLADLHRYSGMGGGEMLGHLLPKKDLAHLKKPILDRQGERFRAEHLAHIPAFPGVRQVFEAFRRRGCRIALASTSQKDELDRYCGILNVADLVDVMANGSEVEHEKPHPDLIELALRRLKLKDDAPALMFGDTPYDAEAALAAGIGAAGALTGHFSAGDLLAAGCEAVFRQPLELKQALDAIEAAMA